MRPSKTLVIQLVAVALVLCVWFINRVPPALVVEEDLVPFVKPDINGPQIHDVVFPVIGDSVRQGVPFLRSP